MKRAEEKEATGLESTTHIDSQLFARQLPLAGNHDTPAMCVSAIACHGLILDRCSRKKVNISAEDASDRAGHTLAESAASRIGIHLKPSKGSVCVCICAREGERERGREGGREGGRERVRVCA
jgi:hypothetical protein